MPHTVATQALNLILKYFSDELPYWPQLPKRTKYENMYIQFSEGFPGIRINQNIKVVQNENFADEVEGLYNDFLENKFTNYSISTDYASGLHILREASLSNLPLIKGQITGPISWGLSVVDETGRGILYNDLLSELATKFLCLKTMWQENYLQNIAKTTIIFIDEPYLASLGSAFVSIPDTKVQELITEVLSHIYGIRGIHCCGATNWSLLLNCPINILSFDAYNYADSLSCYENDVIAFLEKGGNIAWGIVPNEPDQLVKETASSLIDRLGEAISPYTFKGIGYRQILEQSIITPSCGLQNIELNVIEELFELLKQVSQKLKAKLL